MWRGISVRVESESRQNEMTEPVGRPSFDRSEDGAYNLEEEEKDEFPNH
jgi:hypothetical protein